MTQIAIIEEPTSAHRNGAYAGDAVTAIPASDTRVQVAAADSGAQASTVAPDAHTFTVDTGAQATAAEYRPILDLARNTPLAAEIEYRAAQLQNLQQRAKVVRETEEARLDRINREADHLNSTVATQTAAIELERETKRRPLNTKRDAVHATLEAAHLACKTACKEIAIAYDPDTTKPDMVLAVQVASQVVHADELNLPWVVEDHKGVLPRPLMAFGSVLVGSMMGVSIAIMAKFLEYDGLTDRPWVLLGSALTGTAAALFAGEGVKQSSRLATERYYRGKPWKAMAGIAVVASACIVAIDSKIETEGLLQGIKQIELFKQLQHSVSATPSEVAVSQYVLAALLLSFPYVLTQLAHGYRLGRHWAVAVKLRAPQERDMLTRQQARRDNPKVQAALEALAHVRVLRAQLNHLTAAIALVDKECDERVRALAARRERRAEIDAEGKRRIEAAEKAVAAAEREFEILMGEARIASEGLKRFFISLLFRLLSRVRLRRPRRA